MRSFVDLDERIVSAQPGLVIVRAPHDVHAAIIAHAARRLRTTRLIGNPVEATSLRAGAPLFREVASQLGLGPLPTDPAACADVIAQAASSKRAAIVAPMPVHSTWDRAVACELARSSRSLLVVLVTAGDAPAWESASITTFDVVGELTASDKLRWLSAVAETAQNDLPGSDLRTLEAWWSNARRVAPDATIAIDSLSDAAREVLGCLALAGRSLPIAALATLGDDAIAAVDELVAAGFATRYGILLTLGGTADARTLEASASEGARLATARILAGGGPGFDPDPWAYARAAELLVGASAFEAADAAIAKASRGVDDAQAAYEIATRWFAAVTPVTGKNGLFLRIQAAQRALSAGEANDAQRWCESAAALSPTDATIALLMGRSLMQLGDLVAARVSLQKANLAADAANDDEMRARVSSELAEVSYLGGDLTSAAAHANRTIELAKTCATRLAGRNTLGKVHLAQARWDSADEHFADDALAASAAGVLTAELRARLNRGIALMSKGLLDDARVILERVLQDGGKAGEDRARAHAHSNLGVIAYRQHDYASALAHWDSTTRFPQALRGRMATALTIANLAELRLRLGLVDHAEHAVAFGRRLLSGSGSPARSAHFKRVAAQIALVRRNSELARREIDAALVDAEASHDKDVLDAVCIVAARVALEDGDVNRAAIALERAQKHATSDRAKAEVAILVALHLRASGKEAIPAATEALTLARTSGEEDLLAEIHVLLATLHRDAGDVQAAQAHCCRAIAVRDQVAAGLAPDIRAAFLAKADIVALSRLQTSLANTDSDFPEEETPRTPRVARTDTGAPREIIGDDPQIRSLLVAIRKVARSNSTLLIRGESGTGKELVADALHRASERANGPLVSVNCAALVETLLLSELFGHEKGAFTGASARRRGRFEMAEGGTLFLDEIGDISPRTQVALLRVLQEKTFERVGGTQPIRANVRVVCATHRDLKAMVERGEFREDLYYRLRGITLEVPALRQRLGDLPKIAEHLLGRIALERNEQPKAIDKDALDLLQRHRWPGNIRELENVLRAVSLFAEGEAITATDLIDNVEDLRLLAQSGPASSPPMSIRNGASLLPPPPASFSGAVSSVDVGDDGEEGDGTLPEGESGATAVAYQQVRQGAVSLSDMKRQIERDCIARALAETKGNITRAATLLGMKRPRLSQLVKQYGLSSASSEGSQ